jgi:hypothetical protein
MHQRFSLLLIWSIITGLRLKRDGVIFLTSYEVHYRGTSYEVHYRGTSYEVHYRGLLAGGRIGGGRWLLVDSSLLRVFKYAGL